MATGPRQKKTKPELTQEQWDALLHFLAPEPEQAAREYIRIGDRLTRFFTIKSCNDPPSQCDETWNRVAKSITRPDFKLETEPDRYIFGVARNVAREPQPMFVELPEDVPQPIGNDDEFSDEDLQYLERCLKHLASSERQLLERFYPSEGRKKDLRKLLALEIGSANALRHRVFRIRQKLASCIEKCKRAGDAFQGEPS